MDPKQITKGLEEIERVVAAYQGGKLRDGAVPLGLKIVKDLEAELVAHFAVKGFAASLDEHESEAALKVLTLAQAPALAADVQAVEPVFANRTASLEANAKEG